MPSIRDFSGGVINQELQNKDTGAGVLFDCKNVLSSWNGELRKRTGTYWLKNLEEYKRIIPFRLPNGNDVMLLAGDGVLDGYEFISGHQIKPAYSYSGSEITFPTSGWAGNTTNGGYTINITSGAAQNEWGKGFDTPATVRPMTYYNKGSHFVGGYQYANINTTQDITIYNATAQVFAGATIRWCLTCEGNHVGHYKGWIEPVIQYSDDGITYTSVHTDSTNPYPTGAGNYWQGSYHYGLGSGEKTENYTLFRATNPAHVEPHKYWRIHLERRINNTYTYGSERLDLFVSNVVIYPTVITPFHAVNNFFTSTNLDSIKYAQNDTTMILTNGTSTPLQLTYTAGAFTLSSINWTMPASQGYPTCVAFYQNRLWFGGFSAFPTRVWGSSFGNFTDFTIPTTVLATSPIAVDSVEIQSNVENLWGGNNALYCLSEDGVSMIDAQGGIVATDQIEFKLRNREPTNKMTPTVKDDIMVYLGRNKKKILITDYDFVVQRFKAQNISINYDDFLAAGIRELHYIPNKASLIYGMLENGKAVAILFNTDMSKNAIFPIDTNGSFNDIQPIKYGDSTKLAMITQRSGQYMLEEKLPQPDYERMDFMTKTEKEDYTAEILNSDTSYLDCTVKKHYDTAVSYVSDLPYASGDIVSVIADGFYLGEKQLTQSIYSGLYAWRGTNGLIYTETETPDSSSVIYNEDQTVKTGFSVLSLTGSALRIHSVETISTKYYIYKSISNIRAVSASGTRPVIDGNYSRNPSADTQILTGSGNPRQGFAWSNSSRTIWTITPKPYVGAYVAIATDGSRMSYNRTVAAINTESTIYLKDSSPQTGSIVYNSSYQAIGQVTGTGVDAAYNSYIVYNSANYFYDSYITEQHTEERTEDYTRSPVDDISARTVGLQFNFTVNDVVIGYNYDSYAVIKFITPYNLRKFPKEISVNFINSGYLEVGNSFDSLKSVLNNLTEFVSIANRPILMNGNYTKTLDKQTFETPYVIVRSNIGMPFMITGIDYKVDTSNYQGGV